VGDRFNRLDDVLAQLKSKTNKMTANNQIQFDKDVANKKFLITRHFNAPGGPGMEGMDTKRVA
jgi:hypothetical protein